MPADLTQMQRQIHKIVSAKRSAVPEVHSSRMRPEWEGYGFYIFQLQKASTIVCGATLLIDMLASSFLDKYYSSDIIYINIIVGNNVWLAQSISR